MPYTFNDYLLHFVPDLNKQFNTMLSQITDEQLHQIPSDGSNHIAFTTWHWLRTEDNVFNFVLQNRKSPIWLRQKLDERWSLPKISQGTNMPPDEAHALRIPSRDELIQYSNDVLEDVLPYCELADINELSESVTVKEWGERERMLHIGQIIISHGYTHVGEIDRLRTEFDFQKAKHE